MDLTAENKNDPEIKINRKSKILFAVIAILIVGSVIATYWRYMVQRDYIVQAQIDCDPEMENCFIWECDPESTEEGYACTGDPEEDIWYYKIIRRNAKNIPLCDPNNEECAALVCEPGELECSEELCTAENVPEGETCNDPEQYLLENPPEEESECEEDDEECLATEEELECEEGDEECAMEEEVAEECEEGDAECLTEEESGEEEASEITDETESEESADDTQLETNEDIPEAIPALPM